MYKPNNPYTDDNLGPLETLLADDSIMEIMINGYDKIFVERHGRLEPAGIRFESNDHLMQIIERILTPMGRKVDESTPILDVRLPDNSRVHVVIPPIALTGPSLTIRKFPNQTITLERLIEYESLTAEMAEFLRACVLARLNIVVAGGTGSGKTTVFNILCNFIDGLERIIALENASELNLQHEHLIVMETRPPNLEGKGEITMKDLVISATKMRPDRILVAEVRGAEVWDLLQAINTGHDGAMFTIHATSPRDVLARMEIMATESNPVLPLLGIRHHMATAIDLIVQQERLQDGTRRVMKITEVSGMQGDFITMQDIFEFVPTGAADEKITGQFRATGKMPLFMDRFAAAGIQVPPSMFKAAYTFPPVPPPPPPVHPVPPVPPVPPRPPGF